MAGGLQLLPSSINFAAAEMEFAVYGWCTYQRAL